MTNLHKHITEKLSPEKRRVLPTHPPAPNKEPASGEHADRCDAKYDINDHRRGGRFRNSCRGSGGLSGDHRMCHRSLYRYLLLDRTADDCLRFYGDKRCCRVTRRPGNSEERESGGQCRKTDSSVLCVQHRGRQGSPAVRGLVVQHDPARCDVILVQP